MTVNILGDATRSRRASREWLWPLLPMGVSAFALSALVSYHVRQPLGFSALQRAVIGIYQAAGFVPAFFFFLLLFSRASIWFVTGRIERPWSRLARLLGFAFVIAIAMNLQHPPGQGPAHLGAAGGWVAAGLLSLLGYWLSVLLVIPLALATFLLATDFCFYRYFERSLPAGVDGVASVDEATFEAGVEPEVADHLKGLSAATGQAATWDLGADLGSDLADSRSGSVAAAAASLDPGASAAVESGAAPIETEDPPPRRARRARRYAEEDEVAAAPLAGAEVAPIPAEGLAARPIATAAVELPRAEEVAAATPDDEFAVAAAAFDEVAPPPVADRDDQPFVVDLVPSQPVEVELVEVEPVEVEPVRRRGHLAPVDAAIEDELADAPLFAAAARVAAESAPAAEPTATLDGSSPAEEVAAAAGFDDDETAEEDQEGAVPTAEVAETETESETEIGLEAADAGDDEQDDGDDERSQRATSEPEENQVVLIPRAPDPARQRRLFEPQVDDGLLAEAVELVRSRRRVSIGHLQRRLRIGYDEAVEVHGALVRRGLVEQDADD